MGRFLVIAFLASLTALSGVATVSAQATPVASPSASAVVAGPGIDAAVNWLSSQQQPDGSFLGFSGEPDTGATVDTLLALVSAPSADQAVIDGAVAYVTANAAAYVESGPGQAAKLVMVMSAAGADPANIDGLNAVASVNDSIDAKTGLCGSGVFDHALCMMAIASTSDPVSREWVETLRSYQIDNGGWAFDGSREAAMADSNTTAVAVEALIAAGVDAGDPAIQAALGYLKSVMAPDGGFAYAVANPLVADANSTGIVIQALIAAGEDPAGAGWDNAMAALAAFQNASGAFRYMNDLPDDNLFATVQAVPALAGTAFPIAKG